MRKCVQLTRHTSCDRQTDIQSCYSVIAFSYNALRGNHSSSSNNSNVVVDYILLRIIIRPRRSRSAAAYSRQTFPRTFCRSVRASVCPVHCGKTADWIRMTFDIIDRTGPGMRQVLGFGNRSTGRGTFGGVFGARHCNQWGLYGARVPQHRDAALFPNYFGQTCFYYY